MSKFEKEQVLKYPKVLICGYGIVGKSLKELFTFAETYDVDKDMGADFIEPPKTHYDFTFIAVPTPNNDSGSCNIHYIEEALSQLDSEIFIIKSTIPPTTTDFLRKKFNKRIIFSPEFTGETPASKITQDFVILGGEDKETLKVRSLYEKVVKPSFKFHTVKTIEAEIIKYMVNSFLALKVIFCNQFKDIADFYGVAYSNIRDGFILDKRLGESHTFVFEDARGYDSKCLNKDVPAFIKAIKGKGFNKDFIMEKVEEINQSYKV